MINLTTASLIVLLVGIFTSVSILSAYQILFAIPLFYYCYLAIKSGTFKISKSGWLLLAFAMICIISLFINLQYVPKPSKNFGRIKYFFYGVGGIFVLKVWLKESSDKTKKLVSDIFLVTVSIAAIYASFTFFRGREDGRARGFTDTLRYGYGTSMFLITLLSALLHREKIKSWFSPKLGFLAFVTGFVALYLTYTRGAFFAFWCALPFSLFFYKKKLGLSLGGLSVLFVLALVGNYLFGTTQYSSRFFINKNNPSDHVRRSQWKAAIIATQEKPVLGWGFSNFHSQLDRIKNQYDLDAKFYNDAHAHNLFLEVASGTGIVGLVLFIAWVLSWAWEVFKVGGLVRALVIPFGVSWVVGSQFEMTFDANNASMIFFTYALSSCFTLDAPRHV